MKYPKINIGKLGKSPALDWYFCLVCLAVGIVLTALIGTILYEKLVLNDQYILGGGAGTGVTSKDIINPEDIGMTAKSLRTKDETPATVSGTALRDPSI